MRLASTSRAAVSNLMVVERVSNSREVGISFQGQSVRYGDDLQRCEFLNRDRSSIDLIKWEALGGFQNQRTWERDERTDWTRQCKLFLR
jgi:hypothetical protein